MNIERRATKVYLKSLSPLTAIDLINRCKLPSPWREVLLCACVDRKEGFAGVDHLENQYGISLSYWTFVRRFKESLDMIRKSQ